MSFLGLRFGSAIFLAGALTQMVMARPSSIGGMNWSVFRHVNSARLGSDSSGDPITGQKDIGLACCCDEETGG